MEKSFEEFINKMKIPIKLFTVLKSSMQKWEAKKMKNQLESIPYIQ